MRVFTIGHGTRSIDELVACLHDAGVETLVDVRRFPGSRRNPQFNQAQLRAVVEDAGIAYRHAVDLGGRLNAEPGEEEFGCLREPAFRSYAARMRGRGWQDSLDDALREPSACFMCAETPWQRCHRSLIAELLHARGHEVVHLIRPGESSPHTPSPAADMRNGRLTLCGSLVG